MHGTPGAGAGGINDEARREMNREGQHGQPDLFGDLNTGSLVESLDYGVRVGYLLRRFAEEAIGSRGNSHIVIYLAIPIWPRMGIFFVFAPKGARPAPMGADHFCIDTIDVDGKTDCSAYQVEREVWRGGHDLGCGSR